MNPKSLMALLQGMDKALRSLDALERVARGRPSWQVGVAACACAAFMWWGWADINRSMQERVVADSLRASMSPTIYEIDQQPGGGTVEQLSASAAGAAATSSSFTAAASSNNMVQFPGVQDSTQGRIDIQIATDSIDPTRHPLNFGNTDFSVEFWIRFATSEVPDTLAGNSFCDLSGYGFTNSSIFFDNDRLEGLGAPANDGGFGAGVFADSDNSNIGRIMWSMRDAGSDNYTVCSDATVTMGDDAWHHVLFQWDLSSGGMGIYVDGTREGYTATSAVASDVSLDTAATYTAQNPMLVMGNEKHNGATQEPFTGDIDELRISNILRQPSFPTSYTIPVTGFSADTATLGLFHFNEAAGADSLDNAIPLADTITWWRNQWAFSNEGGGTHPTLAASTDSTATVPEFMVFASSWSTGTGTGVYNMMDSSRTRPWQGQNNLPDADQVIVASAGLFPSTNYLDLNNQTGTLYTTEFSTGYWGVVPENGWHTVRFIFMPQAGTSWEPAVVQGSGQSGPVGNFFSNGGSLTPDSIYEMITSVRRLTGTQYEVDVLVYRLDSDDFDRNAYLTTSDFYDEPGPPTGARMDTLTFPGSANHINSVLDFKGGQNEGSYGPGEQGHPWEMFDWQAGDSYSTHSAATWQYGHNGTAGADHSRICCITIMQGTDTAARQWPPPAWTTTEELWEPGND